MFLMESVFIFDTMIDCLWCVEDKNQIPGMTLDVGGSYCEQ